MNTQIKSATPAAVHKGPHPGMLAILYMVLFCAGLYPVTNLYKEPYWPGPWESASTIVPFFQTQGARVLGCMFLQLDAMICLGLFTATVVSRLHFLGARAAGVYIALFGGFFVVFDAMAGTMAHDPPLCRSACRCCDCALLAQLRARRPRLLHPYGTSHGRCLRHRRLHEAAAKLAHRPRPHPRRGRRAQLAAPDPVPQAALPHSAHSLPRLHLDHRRRLPAAEVTFPHI